jgi:hypothetical protein
MGNLKLRQKNFTAVNTVYADKCIQPALNRIKISWIFIQFWYGKAFLTKMKVLFKLHTENEQQCMNNNKN